MRNLLHANLWFAFPVGNARLFLVSSRRSCWIICFWCMRVPLLVALFGGLIEIQTHHFLLSVIQVCFRDQDAVLRWWIYASTLKYLLNRWTYRTYGCQWWGKHDCSCHHNSAPSSSSPPPSPHAATDQFPHSQAGFFSTALQSSGH